jgi:hypothetical protein
MKTESGRVRAWKLMVGPLVAATAKPYATSG